MISDGMGKRVWRNRILVLIPICILLFVVVVVSACSHGSSNSYQYQPVVTEAPTLPPPTPTEQTLATINNMVVSGGHCELLPTNGVYVQAGRTLTLSWSADGNLEGYIFTQNQYNNFKSFFIPSGYEAYGSGSSQTIYATITNTDTYYGVVANRLMLASSVQLYQATLTEQ